MDLQDLLFKIIYCCLEFIVCFNVVHKDIKLEEISVSECMPTDKNIFLWDFYFNKMMKVAGRL
jgi:hypothetical protein